ncbi:Uncharacterised protein [Mycobacteroides abscessus subsp. massiliense]|uniref:Uncharacterized protein n=1 Tax=Mycobacteroides abscessus subsp. massiliense TaxID=1962118 RepID=A0A1T8VIN2_9MYCO|nr:Uncharacterised protein [Mycobacteroides abscessus subsp. massiliense]
MVPLSQCTPKIPSPIARASALDPMIPKVLVMESDTDSSTWMTGLSQLKALTMFKIAQPTKPVVFIMLSCMSAKPPPRNLLRIPLSSDKV